MDSLQRRWHFQGATSDLFQPNTGCAEGGPFAVVVMLAVAQGWLSYSQHNVDAISASAFADNEAGIRHSHNNMPIWSPIPTNMSNLWV